MPPRAAINSQRESEGLQGRRVGKEQWKRKLSVISPGKVQGTLPNVKGKSVWMW